MSSKAKNTRESTSKHDVFIITSTAQLPLDYLAPHDMKNNRKEPVEINERGEELWAVGKLLNVWLST